jgi:oligopeptidase B
VRGIEYEIEHRNDRFIIKTNLADAEDYKIATAPLDDPSPVNWRDLVPHRPGRFIVGIIVLKNWLVRLEREEALPRIVVRDMSTGEEHAIAFDEEAYSLGFGDMREFDTDILRFTYSSMTTPAQGSTRHAHTDAGAAQDAGSAERARSGRLCDAAHSC